MQLLDLLLPVAELRSRAVDLRHWSDPRSPEGRRAALLHIEIDLWLMLAQGPLWVRVPLLAAAVLVRLARG